MGEASTNVNFPPATSDNYDQSQNAEQYKNKGEEATEVGNSTAETVESGRPSDNIEEEKMERHVQDDNDEKTEADKHIPGTEKPEAIYDLCHGLLDSERGGDRKQNICDQGCKQGNTTKPFPGKDDDVEKLDEGKENIGGSEGSKSLTEEQGVENIKLQKSPIYGKIIEEEIRETPSGSQISTEIKYININFESKSNSKTGEMDTLSESFCYLNLND